MDLTLTDEQRALADSARAFLHREWSTDTVRELEAEPGGFRTTLWKRTAELGWPGVVFCTDDGGLGGELTDLVVIAEQLGRAAASTPLLDSVSLGALPLSWAPSQPPSWTPVRGNEPAHSPSEGARRRWLPGLVSGEYVGAAALLEPDGRTRWPASEAPRHGPGWLLQGRKTMVGFAATADVLLVSTRLAGRGPALVAVPADASGLTSRRLNSLGGDPLFEVTLGGVRVSRDDLVADGSAAEELLGRALTVSRVLDCAVAVGLSEGALALGVTHAKDRAQFGRPIGAFQAVANRLVDVRSDLDALRLLTHRAAWAVTRDDPDAAVHTATMAGYAGWTAATASAATHQVMGAIGFTMEHDLQLFTRRLKAFETRVGPPATHLETVATGLGLACE